MDSTDSGMSLQLEDGTGRLRAKHYYETMADGTPEPEKKAWLESEVRNESFVKVHGVAKMASGRRTLTGVQITPLKDPNELTLHFLEVMHVHRDRVERVPFSKGGGSDESASSSSSAFAGSGTGFGMAGMPSMTAGGGGMGGFAGSSTPLGAAPGMPALGGGAVKAEGGMSEEAIQNKLKELISEKGRDSEEGAFIPDLVKAMAGHNVDETGVRNAIEALSMNGHIYSTVDDDHVQSTEA